MSKAMEHVRYLYVVQGDPYEFSRDPDGVTYHVPVLSKGEI